MKLTNPVRKVRNPYDGRCHFSEIKEMANSPAHYYSTCTEPRRDATGPMTIGSAVDRIVFGTPEKVVLYPGKVRNGSEWDAFRKAHADKVICIRSEWDTAHATAELVLRDPVAGPLLRLAGNDFQRTLEWETYGGLECAAGLAGGADGRGGRGGFDIINERESLVVDLKASGDAEPDGLMRHARRMLWHAQGRWYLDGAQAKGIDCTRFKLIVAETSGIAVTVLTLGPRVLEAAARSISHWVERLKGCEASGHWPGYQQTEVEWDEVEDAGLVFPE